MSGYRFEDDPAVEKLIVLMALPTLATAAIGFYAPQVRAWTLAHAVTVHPAHAAVVIPGGFGLDGPRIAFAAFVLLALIGIAMVQIAPRTLSQEH